PRSNLVGPSHRLSIDRPRNGDQKRNGEDQESQQDRAKSFRKEPGSPCGMALLEKQKPAKNRKARKSRELGDGRQRSRDERKCGGSQRAAGEIPGEISKPAKAEKQRAGLDHERATPKKVERAEHEQNRNARERKIVELQRAKQHAQRP